MIISVDKGKGSRSECENYTGISQEYNRKGLWNDCD